MVAKRAWDDIDRKRKTPFKFGLGRGDDFRARADGTAKDHCLWRDYRTKGSYRPRHLPGHTVQNCLCR